MAGKSGRARPMDIHNVRLFGLAAVKHARARLNRTLARWVPSACLSLLLFVFAPYSEEERHLRDVADGSGRRQQHDERARSLLADFLGGLAGRWWQTARRVAFMFAALPARYDIGRDGGDCARSIHRRAGRRLPNASWRSRQKRGRSRVSAGLPSTASAPLRIKSIELCEGRIAGNFLSAEKQQGTLLLSYYYPESRIRTAGAMDRRYAFLTWRTDSGYLPEDQMKPAPGTKLCREATAISACGMLACIDQVFLEFSIIRPDGPYRYKAFTSTIMLAEFLSCWLTLLQAGA